MNPAHQRRPIRYAAVAGLLTQMLPAIARAEYLVAPGDTIEVRVAGLADMSQHAQVQQDGTIALQGAGQIRVGGLALAEMRARIISALASKVMWQRLSDGQQRIVAVQPDDVVVGIAEYRPVYVSGDVLTPGQHGFQPAMTVRQAVALSGGYSIQHGTPFGSADPLEMQSQYASAARQLAKQQVHEVRLEAELAGKQEIEFTLPSSIPVPATTLADLLRAEREELRISAGDFELQRTSLLNDLGRSKDLLDKLSAELADEVTGLRSDQQDLDRLLKAYASGVVTTSRVVESRHAVLAGTARVIQTNSSIDQTKQRIDEVTQRLEQLVADRRLLLLTGMTETRLSLLELRAKLNTLHQQMVLMQSSRNLVHFGEADISKLTIVRKQAGAWTSISASLDTELQPGDALTVRVDASIVGSNDPDLSN